MEKNASVEELSEDQEETLGNENITPRDASGLDTSGVNSKTPPYRSRNVTITPRESADPEDDDPKLKLINNDHLNDGKDINIYSATGSSMRTSLSDRSNSPNPGTMVISKQNATTHLSEVAAEL